MKSVVIKKVFIKLIYKFKKAYRSFSQGFFLNYYKLSRFKLLIRLNRLLGFKCGINFSHLPHT